MSFSKFLAVLVSGALFGFGLALSTMVQPEVVLSFLRFQDWGLMLVMGGAVLVTLIDHAARADARGVGGLGIDEVHDVGDDIASVGRGHVDRPVVGKGRRELADREPVHTTCQGAVTPVEGDARAPGVVQHRQHALARQARTSARRSGNSSVIDPAASSHTSLVAGPIIAASPAASPAS